jgi:lantibiotic modifying enzyme
MLEMARQGARFLLGQAQAAPSGTYWLFRRSKPFNLPNFSHGTAGVAYVLATVGSLAGDEALLAGAQAGFEYIRSIAKVDDGILRIPYGWGSDSWDGLYEFGWAHGLSGDAVLFQRLQQVGIEPQLASEYEELVKSTLVSIGLPGATANPFAEPSTPLDQRFGRAGVLVLLSQWSRDAPAASDITDLRNALWRHIESAAVRNDGGAYWEIDAPEFMGGGRAAFTGHLHGAAGIGLALLRLHSSMTMQPPYLLLPDDAAAWADWTPSRR